MQFSSEPSVRVERPTRPPIPLVLDSPHSGVRYPRDFRAAQPLHALRTAEDTHVDALYASAPRYGATLICAEFPRCYVDCNRAPDDLDTRLLDAAWHKRISPSDKSRLGYGLIWRRLDDGSDIYDRALTPEEIEARIDQCYQPYWRALSMAVHEAHQFFGVCYHINCHSMPSHSTHASHLPVGTPHADVVLGDRDGSTCSAEFLRVIEDGFSRAGLSVKRNDPYKGVELVRAFGRPKEKLHSVQIEVNRALYMNETTRERNAGFDALRTVIEDVLKRVAAYAEHSS